MKFAGTPDYVPQIDRAVDWIEKFADEPVVLAGDFNAPITSSLAQYARVVERLQDLGLVDTHRTSRGLTADEEPTEATYFQHRRSEKPFHIDHVVMPSTWARRATVEIGDFETWVGSGRSDHVPVLVDVPDDDMR